jgi:hypothetical protein
MINASVSPEQQEKLINILRERFEKNMNRHKDLVWANIEAKCTADPNKFLSLYEMENTGGEPDVVSHNILTGE